MDEDIKKMYQEEFKRVEEELIDLRVIKSYFDSYEKDVYKSKKETIENTAFFSAAYGFICSIFNKENIENVPKAILIYLVLEIFYYNCKNIFNIRRMKKVNVLDLEMMLYDSYERFKGLANADFSLIQEAESQKDKDKDNFVKMKK